MMTQRSSLTFFFALLSIASNELRSNDLDKCSPSEFIIDRPEYALTEDEKIELIEKELILALNQLDECISKIDNAPMSNGSNSSSASANSYGESSNQSSASMNNSGESLEPNSNSDASSNQTNTSIESSADLEDQKSQDTSFSGSESSGDIDFNDDDIVARQIREAAIAETDPEMKELLWERYRQYKGIN
jgi:hypothetical protein